MRTLLSLSICCLILLVLMFVSFSSFAATPQLKDPILTPIPGLVINSKPGVITLTNNTGKDISVSKMLLQFNLDQASISSLWGSPWLNWAPKPIQKNAVKAYQFVNQANMPNGVFRSGETITVNYNPEPWNNPNAPKDVQLFNMVYPLNPVPIVSGVTSQGGVNTISITNASDKTISLDGAQVRMDYSGQIQSSIWGTPWGNWSVSQGSPNYVLNAGTANIIPARGVMTLSFNGDSQPINNIQLWVQDSTTPTTKGEIDVNMPALPPGVTVNPQVTITGPSFPSGQTFIGTWGQTLIQKDLQEGSYTLTAPEIATSTTAYVPSFNPNPVVVSGSQPVATNLTYGIKQLGQLSVQMGDAPFVGVNSPVVNFKGPEFSNGLDITAPWANTFFVCPGGLPSCPGIKAGDYTITVPKVYSENDAYVATIANPVKVSINQTATVAINYQAVPKGTFVTIVTMPPSQDKKLQDQTFQVNFVNQTGRTFAKTLALGANNVSLPIDDTYAITAPSISGFIPTVNPSSVTVTQTGTPDVAIDYKAGLPNKYVVYFGGWFGMLYNLNNLPTEVTAVNLSFANINSSYQVDTTVSGSFSNIPAPNVRMLPTYINWTTFKFNRPNTKVLMAVGGSTFSAIWNSVLTASSADTIAQNIATVVNRPYPVYRGEFSYASEMIGNVTMDGVDLDVETGSRMSQQVANNIILLTKSLKKYLNPGKIITFAGFSTGADPNDSRCTVPNTPHCGEDISILQNLGSTFEWVNVMAYDAGQEYALNTYKVALANYASYIGQGKTVLGLDVQNQWPGFSETASQLAVKAAWQKQNGYGGIMFWGVNVENNPTKEQQYLNAITAAIK